MEFCSEVLGFLRVLRVTVNSCVSFRNLLIVHLHLATGLDWQNCLVCYIYIAYFFNFNLVHSTLKKYDHRFKWRQIIDVVIFAIYIEWQFYSDCEYRSRQYLTQKLCQLLYSYVVSQKGKWHGTVNMDQQISSILNKSIIC